MEARRLRNPQVAGSNPDERMTHRRAAPFGRALTSHAGSVDSEWTLNWWIGRLSQSVSYIVAYSLSSRTKVIRLSVSIFVRPGQTLSGAGGPVPGQADGLTHRILALITDVC